MEKKTLVNKVLDLDFLKIKIAYKSDKEIVVFVYSWYSENTFYNLKVKNLFKDLRDNYSNVVVFILPSWFKEGTRHYKLLSSFCNQICILANSNEELEYYKLNGLNTILCNQNCWVDEKIFTINYNKKIYDFVLNANNNKNKRHFLTKPLNKEYKTLFITYDVPTDINERELFLENYNFSLVKKNISAELVASCLNECRIGLSLSQEEGGCFASTEYLLCGLPVISTPSKGGRDVWYNSRNSIICNPAEESLLQAAREMINSFSSYNPKEIRQQCIGQQRKFRQKFFEYLRNYILDENLEIRIMERFSNQMGDPIKLKNISLEYINNYC